MEICPDSPCYLPVDHYGSHVYSVVPGYPMFGREMSADLDHFQTFEQGTIQENIHRRRRQMLVHSIIYYVMNDNIISDHTFDAWGLELARLQEENPEASKDVLFHREAFSDFTGDTGAFLPLGDVRANATAYDLINGTWKGRL